MKLVPQVMEHPHAVWSARASGTIDLIIPDVSPEDAIERLVVSEISGDIFEVCCLTWSQYGFGLGDQIRVRETGLHDLKAFVDVVESSNRQLYRLFLDNPSSAAMQNVASMFASTGNLIEVSGPVMMAVDAPTPEADEWMYHLLEGEGHPSSTWQYENVRTAV